jgi:hypothetical protein
MNNSPRRLCMEYEAESTNKIQNTTLNSGKNLAVFIW